MTMNSPSPEAKRILFIIGRGDSFGGSSMHVQDMAARLTQDGHEAAILVGGTPDMEVPQRFRRKGVAFTCIEPMGRAIHPWRDLQAVLRIRRFARDFRPHLVSTHASKGGALGRIACLGLKAPVIYTPHCWSFVDGFSLAPFYQFIERTLAWITSKIVTVSEDERQLALSRGVGTPEKIVTIHNGVLEDVPPPRRTVQDGPVRLLMIGRFEKQKDQALLLRALAGLRTKNAWELTLVGDGPALGTVRQLCRDLQLEDKVTFAGYRSQVSETLACADVFILASNWEGFPRSILEAMRSGLPVIASDVGGCRESVIHGVTGLVVPQGDRLRLRAAIADLVDQSELRLRMGEAGRNLFLEKFTFDEMYQNYCGLYRKLFALGQGSSKASTRGTRRENSAGTGVGVLE